MAHFDQYICWTCTKCWCYPCECEKEDKWFEIFEEETSREIIDRCIKETRSNPRILGLARMYEEPERYWRADDIIEEIQRLTKEILWNSTNT